MAMDVVEPIGSHFTLAMKREDTLGVHFSSGYCFRFCRIATVSCGSSYLQNGLRNKILKMSLKVQLFQREEAR